MKIKKTDKDIYVNPEDITTDERVLVNLDKYARILAKEIDLNKSNKEKIYWLEDNAYKIGDEISSEVLDKAKALLGLEDE